MLFYLTDSRSITLAVILHIWRQPLPIDVAMYFIILWNPGLSISWWPEVPEVELSHAVFALSESLTLSSGCVVGCSGRSWVVGLCIFLHLNLDCMDCITPCAGSWIASILLGVEANGPRDVFTPTAKQSTVSLYTALDSEHGALAVGYQRFVGD